MEMIFGLVLSVIGGGDAKADPATIIYKGLITGNKIIQKEKKKEMDDSLHEESQQILKDFIREAGKQ